MEGTRVAKKEGGGKKSLIITGVVIGALAAAYLGLCAFAMGRDAILPNVSVSNIDVSGMTLEQAQSTVETQLAQKGQGVRLEVILTQSSASPAPSAELTAGDMDIDAAQSAQDAWQVGHENFFTAGPQLVGHMLGMSSMVPVVIPEDEPAMRAVLDGLAQQAAANSEDRGYEIKGDRLEMVKGAPVVAVDWEQAERDVREGILHLIKEKFMQESMGETGEVTMPIQIVPSQSTQTDPDFDAIHRAVYTEPRDASLDLEAMEITDHAVGVDFDVEALKTAYQNAGSGETFSIPLTLTQPKVTRDDLGGSLFRDVLGEATSTVSGSAARKSNVKLAASACNEKILLPGEVFSYNDSTGPRTAARGYQSAPAYYNGATVQEVGGGVCQPSSTIYYAVLHTSLEITERHNHRYAVGYVPDGMDATVSYGALDFKFKNSTDYPIKIVTSSYDAGGARKLNVKIYGTNVDGIRVEPTAGVFGVVAPTVQYLPDANVARGSLVLDREQNAYRGRSAQTYRTIYAADGSVLEKQDLGVSVYKMRPTVYHYNPADGDPTTWVGGQPPQDPGTTTPVDPGTTPPVDPGTTTPADPGTTAPSDPGTTPDPGTATDPEPAPDPVPPPSDSGLRPIDPNATAA
ncbi:hypothetical protein D1641_12145 [Colidextribacter sp. OB.20]|uniref:VanW family protein n=1 Tax=Colidextribacter sp. OB.20 TaxID=2304568 RepID=UPI00136AC2C9|nr:VanW family protein [Colidextribacter sp. OB.20]NBI10757.1 hypothetical protein [Colidextribacter sp. OB.20]